MASFNKVIMIGHLARDPELTFSEKQTAICKFTIASNYKYGEKEEVCFVDCVLFGKSGESVNKIFKKGGIILVEGRLKLDQWEDTNGNKRSKHSIVCDRFGFVGKTSGDKEQIDPDKSGKYSYNKSTNHKSTDELVDTDMDIPF